MLIIIKTCNAHLLSVQGPVETKTKRKKNRQNKISPWKVLRRDWNVVVQRQDLRLSGREFQMRGSAEEKDVSLQECWDLGSIKAREECL